VGKKQPGMTYQFTWCHISYKKKLTTCLAGAEEEICITREGEEVTEKK
jgi:hypothetical protein